MSVFLLSGYVDRAGTSVAVNHSVPASNLECHSYETRTPIITNIFIMWPGKRLFEYVRVGICGQITVALIPGDRIRRGKRWLFFSRGDYILSRDRTVTPNLMPILFLLFFSVCVEFLHVTPGHCQHSCQVSKIPECRNLNVSVRECLSVHMHVSWAFCL